MVTPGFHDEQIIGPLRSGFMMSALMQQQRPPDQSKEEKGTPWVLDCVLIVCADRGIALLYPGMMRTRIITAASGESYLQDDSVPQAMGH